MLTAGHASDGRTDQDACRRLSKGRYADILALCVLERSPGSRDIFRGSALQQCGHEQGNGAESRTQLMSFMTYLLEAIAASADASGRIKEVKCNGPGLSWRFDCNLTCASEFY